MSEDNEGPKQRFGVDAFDDVRLAVAKAGLAGCLREEGPTWSSPEDLLRFDRKEGNELTLSAPKVMMVKNPTAKIEELYFWLAHVEPCWRQRLHVRVRSADKGPRMIAPERNGGG